MRKLVLGCFLLSAVPLFSQETEPEVSISLLENDNIADVNINQASFIKSLGSYTDYLKTLTDLPKNQRVGIVLIAHPSGPASVSCFTNPKNEAVETRVLKDLSAMTLENTKLVDFPVLMSLNCKTQKEAVDFEGYKNPVDARMEAYKAASLQAKVKLNKEYAINEVLPVLAAYELQVDDQFVGVKNLGKLVDKTDFSQPQDVFAMTDYNTDYWRATLEMQAGNQLVPLTRIFMLVSQGEMDYAKRYVEIISLFSNSKTSVDKYLRNISERLELFNKQLTTEMKFGMAEHDKGNYVKAMDIYNDVLRAHPYSSWALYEHYFSQNTMQIEKKEIEVGDQSNWEKAKVEIYKHNPVYDVDVHANSGQQFYLIMRRQQIQKLFANSDDQLADVYTYAEIATDLNAPGFAAQLFWLTGTFDKEHSQESINNFLYCLDKLGNTEIKTNFKGDFDKVFKKIDAQKDKEMKSSDAYKMMKN